jgi:hypothetical protein
MNSFRNSYVYCGKNGSHSEMRILGCDIRYTHQLCLMLTPPAPPPLAVRTTVDSCATAPAWGAVTSPIARPLHRATWAARPSCCHGPCPIVKPWAGFSPYTVPHFLFFFQFSFRFRNCKDMYKIVKCVENEIKLKKI